MWEPEANRWFYNRAGKGKQKPHAKVNNKAVSKDQGREKEVPQQLGQYPSCFQLGNVGPSAWCMVGWRYIKT